MLINATIKLNHLSKFLTDFLLKIVIIMLCLFLNALLYFVNSLLIITTHDGLSDYILGYGNPSRKTLLITYYILQAIFCDLVPPIMLLFVIKPKKQDT